MAGPSEDPCEAESQLPADSTGSGKLCPPAPPVSPRISAQNKLPACFALASGSAFLGTPAKSHVHLNNGVEPVKS